MTTAAIVITSVLVFLNAMFVVALDRSPSAGYQIGAPASAGLYPLIEPPAGWRRHRRQVCLYGSILTGVAICIAPMLIR